MLLSDARQLFFNVSVLGQRPNYFPQKKCNQNKIHFCAFSFILNSCKILFGVMKTLIIGDLYEMQILTTVTRTRITDQMRRLCEPMYVCKVELFKGKNARLDLLKLLPKLLMNFPFYKSLNSINHEIIRKEENQKKWTN